MHAYLGFLSTNVAFRVGPNDLIQLKKYIVDSVMLKKIELRIDNLYVHGLVYYLSIMYTNRNLK